MRKFLIFLILGILVLCPGFKCMEENTEYSDNNPYIPGNTPKIDHISSTNCKYQNKVNESDVRIATDRRDSNIYMAFVDSRNVFHKLYFVSSPDFGKTWSQEVRVDHTPNAANCDAPLIDFYQNTIYMAWIDNRKSLYVPYGPQDNPDDDLYDLYFNYSTDNGKTWQAQDIRINKSPLGISRLEYDSIVMEQAAGKVYIAWLDRRNDKEEIYFNFSEDAGQTWQAQDIKIFEILQAKGQKRISHGNYYLKASGNTICLGLHYTPSNKFYFVNSKDGGLTWQANPVVFTNTNSASMTTDENHVYIARSSQGNLLMERSDDGGDNFTSYNSNQTVGYIPDIVCDGNTVYVTYLNGSPADIFFTTFDLNENTWTPPTNITQTSQEEAEVEFFASGNFLHLAWLKYSDLGTKAVSPSYRRSPDKGNSWEDIVPLFDGYRKLHSLLADNSGNAFVVGKDDGQQILTVQEIEQGTPGQTNTVPGESAKYQKAFFHSMDVALETVYGKRGEILGNYVYGAWLDNRNNPDGTEKINDVFFNYSWNNGTSWQTEDIKIGQNAYDASDGTSIGNKIKLSSSENYVYALWLDQREGSGKLYLNHSLDYGKTWAESPVLIHESMTTQRFFPNLRSYQENVFAVWQDFRTGSGRIYFNTSEDNGNTWQANDILLDQGYESKNPDMNSYSNQVYVVWEQSNGEYSDIYFNGYDSSVKKPLGTPTRVDTGDAAYTHGSRNPKVAGIANYVFVVWEEERDGGNNVYFNYSNNFGTTWNTPIRLNTPPDPAVSKISDIRIARYASSIYVVWREARAGDPKRYNVYMNYSRNLGVTWQENDIRINQNTEGEANCASCYLAAKGSIVSVVWGDYRNGSADVYCNISLNYGRTWNPQDIRLDTTDTLGANTSLPYYPLIASDDKVHFFWLETKDADAASHIYYKNTATTWQPPTITDITPSQGGMQGNTSITIRGTNFTVDPQARAIVLIDGMAASNVSVQDDQTILCRTPAATTPGSKNVVVVAKGGAAIRYNGFTYINYMPMVTITSPADNTNFFTPATVSITANAVDSDRTVSRVEFYNGSTILGIDTTAPYNWLWENVPVGNYSLIAKAYDNHGSSSISTAVNIVVRNPTPVVSITSPTNGAAFSAPANITIEANASDENRSNRTVTLVEFYNGTSLIGADSTAPYSFVWNNVIAGTYVLRAKAYDNEGANSTSGDVNITVGASGSMMVSPSENMLSEGPKDGPFIPSSKQYTIDAIDTNVSWEITSSANWVDITANTGTTIPGTPSNITVSINGNATELSEGSYDATLTFTNLTNGQGNTTRNVKLNVQNVWSETSGIYAGHIPKIAFSPNVGMIFAGGEASGIFLSADNGTSWERSMNGINDNYITDLVVHPGNGHVYVGIPGDGIYQSQDNGANFAKVFDLIPKKEEIGKKKRNFLPKSKLIRGYKDPDVLIAVNAMNGNVFAAIHGIGVYRSIDNGETWTNVTSNLPTNKTVDIMCQRVNGNVFVKIDTSSEQTRREEREYAIYRSSDNGATWIHLANFPTDYSAYAEKYSDGLIFLADFNGVSRSVDNGSTWTPAVNNGWPETEEKEAMAYHQSQNRLYLLTTQHLYVSGDNGDNWTQVALNIKTPELLSLELFETYNILFIGTEGNGILRSANNGVTWSYSNEGMSGALIQDIKVAQVTKDQATRATTLFASTYGAGLYKSNDNGSTWSNVSSLQELPVPLFYIWAVDVHPVSGNIYIAGSEIHNLINIYMSPDNGASWSKISNQDFVWLENLIIHYSGSPMFLSGMNANGDEGVYRSDDNGANWTHVSSGIQDTRIDYLTMQGNTAILAGARTGIYRSIDNGASWTKIYTPPVDDDVYSLGYYAYTNAIFAGLGTGVYRSLNNGGDWTPLGDTMEGVESFGVHVDKNSIYCGTWNGIFRSTDHGTVWSQNGLSKPILAKCFAFVPDTSIIVAGTSGFGIYHNLPAKKK